MKRLFTALLCAVLVLFALSAVTLAAGGEILQYQAECVLDAGGAAQMTVTVKLNLPTPVAKLQLPIGQGTDAAVAGHKAKRVRLGADYALKIASETGFSGEQTFVLSYTLPKVVTKTEEGQSLALDLIVPDWSLPMAAAAFTVRLPAAFAGTPAYVGGYLADTVDDVLALTAEGATFSGAFTEPVKDHDSLRVTLALPADYFDLHSAVGVSSVASLVVVCLLLLLAFFYWYRTLFNKRVTARVRPLPPDGSAAGELPMLLHGADPRLPLQIFQWASQGYLALHINPRGRIVLRQNIAMGTERRRQEQLVFSSVFDRDHWCDAESLRFGRLSARYADAMRGYWRKRLYSHSSGSPMLLRGFSSLAVAMALLGTASTGLPQSTLRWLLLGLSAVVGLAGGLLVQRGCVALSRRNYKKAALYALVLVAFLTLAKLGGGLATMVLSLAFQIFAGTVTVRGGKRSVAGREMLAQAQGFSYYLQHVSQHQLRMLLRDDSQYFYKTLPLAEAMGMGQAFAARFGEAEMEPCAFYESQKPLPRTAMGYYAVFKRTLARMENAAKGK